MQVLQLPLCQVSPDPDQPRTTFDETALRELANSIRENGCIQPITVRPGPDGGYIVVAGERRYRAHCLLSAETIPAIIKDLGGADLRVVQLIENSARADVHPLEEAEAYQRLMDEHGLSIDDVAKRAGKTPNRIRDRVELLTLKPEYRKLFRSGAITPTQAWYIGQLSDRGQDTLFKAINAGRCPDVSALKAAWEGIREAEAQIDVFGMMGETARPAATACEVSQATALERRIESVKALVAAGFKDGEVVAVRRVNPDNAARFADELSLIQKSLALMEGQLRKASIQADLAL
jgi:ParB family chromosome partitioning protein